MIDLPKEEVLFTPYLIPFIELRRLVRDAREAISSEDNTNDTNDTFTLTYTKLGLPPGLKLGDTITMKFNEGSYPLSCEKRERSSKNNTSSLSSSSTSCDDEEFELLMKPLSSWAAKMLAFFSFPVKPGNNDNFTELGCVC